MELALTLATVVVGSTRYSTTVPKEVLATTLIKYEYWIDWFQIPVSGMTHVDTVLRHECSTVPGTWYVLPW